jgi:hypothetical protein
MLETGNFQVAGPMPNNLSIIGVRFRLRCREICREGREFDFDLLPIPTFEKVTDHDVSNFVDSLSRTDKSLIGI